jgi:O-antigen/teichoic acid export membrane protein
MRNLIEAAISLSRRSAARSVGILASGTLIAHAITIIVMPINTRIYSPTDFTTLAIFSGIVSILAPIVCFRFDAAIIIPENEEEAVQLLVLSLLCAALFSIGIGLVAFLTPYSVYLTFNAKLIYELSWLFPLSVALIGTYIATQAWHVRVKGFKQIALSRGIQSAFAAGAQVGIGYTISGPLGLLLGYTINFGAGAIILIRQISYLPRRYNSYISITTLSKTFSKYSNFPKYSIWEGLANGLSNSAPLVMIAVMAPGPEAGYLTLSLFVLQAPLALIGNAIGQVYLSGAPSALRDDKLGKYTGETMVYLVRAGAGPIIFAAIASPYLFTYIFGEEWRRSGVLIAWMSPWFLLQFIASPVCNALHVTGHQRTMMIFHIMGMILRISIVWIVGLTAVNVVSEAWAITGWIFYSAYLYAIMRVVRPPAEVFSLHWQKTVAIIFPFLVAGLILSLLA